MDGEFTFIDEPEFDYPVGIYKDIKVYFVHYKTEQESVQKWVERSKRILWDNIYVIATGHGGLECTELMERFDRLEYENKIMFTSHSWAQYRWAKQVKILKDIEHMPPLSEVATLGGKRYYETAFDLADWIAKNEKKKTSGK